MTTEPNTEDLRVRKLNDLLLGLESKVEATRIELDQVGMELERKIEAFEYRVVSEATSKLVRTVKISLAAATAVVGLIGVNIYDQLAKFRNERSDLVELSDRLRQQIDKSNEGLSQNMAQFEILREREGELSVVIRDAEANIDLFNSKVEALAMQEIGPALNTARDSMRSISEAARMYSALPATITDVAHDLALIRSDQDASTHAIAEVGLRIETVANDLSQNKNLSRAPFVFSIRRGEPMAIPGFDASIVVHQIGRRELTNSTLRIHSGQHLRLPSIPFHEPTNVRIGNRPACLLASPAAGAPWNRYALLNVADGACPGLDP
ncbi:MAG: hypothetical protein KF823_01040 [Xanthomonadales bacterium]|nr:hypothetical protein [Xanthomonadales bacterium]